MLQAFQALSSLKGSLTGGSVRVREQRSAEDAALLNGLGLGDPRPAKANGFTGPRRSLNFSATSAIFSSSSVITVANTSVSTLVPSRSSTERSSECELLGRQASAFSEPSIHQQTKSVPRVCLRPVVLGAISCWAEERRGSLASGPRQTNLCSAVLCPVSASCQAAPSREIHANSTWVTAKDGSKRNCN